MGKGTTNNPNGRPKGKPNKVTAELKDWMKELIDSNREKLEQDLMKLEPAQRWKLIEKLLGYVVPKMQSVEAKIDLNKLSDEQLDSIVNELVRRSTDGDVLP